MSVSQQGGGGGSGADQVEFRERVTASSGGDADDDRTMTVGNRGMPSRAARNRYIIGTLDSKAQPDSESSTYFYSEGKTMNDTGVHGGDPSGPTHADWASKNEVPPGATPWGEGHDHPTGARYVGAEARNPMGSIRDDIRMAAQEGHATSWVRLTTGEVIQIDTNGGWVQQIRGPLNANPAAFPQPVQIPRDMLLVPERHPMLGI